MEWLIVAGVAIVLVPLGILAQRKGWIDMAGKHSGGRGGGGAGLAGSIDEVFAPTKHEAAQERDRQSSMPAPAPIPGDGDMDIFTSGGKVRIDLDSNRVD